MKITWEAYDIRCGLIVGKPHTKERFIIGYLADRSGLEDKEARFTLNSLVDGMVMGPYTVEALAEKLTANRDMLDVVIDHPRMEWLPF